MAQYFTDDFADFSTCSGVDCGDWTRRLRTDLDAYSVTSGDLTIGTNLATDWLVLSWDDLDADPNRDNIEILALVTYVTGTQLNLIARGSGADESASHYAVRMTTTTIGVAYCAGSDGSTVIATASRTHSLDTDYWVRVRINGTSLKVKSWAGAIGDEPGTWAVDTTDSNVTGVGWVGVAKYNVASTVTIKQFGVGTNGDTAPDSAGGGGTTISLTDSATGVDALAGIAVALGLSDTGVGVDNAPGAAASLSLSDSGAGTDALTLAALLALADTGTGADALTLAVALQIADSGAGADLVNLLTGQLISLADSGAGADAIAAVTVSLALADLGAGTDATVIQAALQLADAGSGVDALSVLTATFIQILDAGAGADGLSIAVAVPVSDAGLGADLLAIQAMVALVENVTGADAVIRFDSAARIFSITFTLARRRAEFAFRTRTASFTLN